ncbi:hypothetical protein L1887_35663 [Cichorium endivia]|nr:hypothetical protein L1887_35663 [Cichorium endivia]
MILLSEQRRELPAAITSDSDLDFAFQLQMEEAIKVSSTSQPSSSMSSSHQPFLLLNEVADSLPASLISSLKKSQVPFRKCLYESLILLRTINSIGVLQHEKLATLMENLHFRKEQLSKDQLQDAWLCTRK